MRRREFIALMGASVTWPLLRWRSNRGGPIVWVAYWRSPRDAPCKHGFFRRTATPRFR